MPKVDVTKEELEALIDAVMLHRLNNDGDIEYGIMLATLHLKLEGALELWINGGTENLEVPDSMKEKGVLSWVKEHPPHAS